MSIDGSDLINAFLDEQARINAAIDDGSVDELVVDTQLLNTELIGMTGTETLTVTGQGSPPHKWDDGQTYWNFFRWP